MPTYLTFIPGFSINAEVEAPDTKHARTTFLDYLQRNNYIGWDQRQIYRKKIKTGRVEPGEVSTTIQLVYDMQEGPPPMIVAGPTAAASPYAAEEEDFEEKYDSAASFTTHPAKSDLGKLAAEPIRGGLKEATSVPAATTRAVELQTQKEELDVGRVPVVASSPIAQVSRQMAKVSPRLKRGF